MSGAIIIRTQAELDAALRGDYDWIDIESERGVWPTVRAYGSATVTATAGVAVHLHHASVSVAGGVVLDHTHNHEMDGREWCAHHGVTVEGETAYLYKALNERWTTDRGTDYSPGSTPSADDWRDDRECGGGLHFGPTPAHALAYLPEAVKFVRVGVDVNTLRSIPHGTAKAKAPAVTVACVEVDIDGREVTQ